MIGSQLGHYRILELLGKGGMGEVYLAEDTKLGRRVALKILSSELLGDLDRRQRFEREARAAAAISHPNIVTIHSVEEDDGRPFLTLELVEGQTLGELVRPGGLPLERLLAIAIPLADAVGAAHQRGITHRDLKPANVMLTTDGRVKVLDFGLAKLREDLAAAAVALMPTQELTGEGRILGTVAYMSPEQAEGKAVDPRTDVFALGVLLYELATGERPFKGDTQLSILSAIIRETPTSVSTLRRELPRDLARIVQRCLSKDPEDRYQSAKDLRNDLRALKDDLVSGEVVSRSAAPAPAAAPLWRRPAIAIGAAVALAAAALWFGTRAAPAPAERPFASISLTRLTTTGTAGMAAISGDGRYAAYVVSEDRQQSLWLRQVSTSSNVQIVAPERARYDGVAFSPDGNYIYYVYYPAGSNRADLYQVPVLGGGARRVLVNIDTPPSFSPDGRQFAFGRGYPGESRDAVLVANADGSGEREIITRRAPAGFALSGVAWSPDGRRIAAAGLDRAARKGSIVLVDVQSGTEATLGTHEWQSVGYMSWMPDGRHLLVNAAEGAGESSGQIWSVAYPDGETNRVTNDLSRYTGMSMSTDGRSFVTVRQETRSRIWASTTGQVDQMSEITAGAGTDDGLGGMSWTPDGRLIFATTTSGNADIWIMNSDGSNRVQLTNALENDYLPLVTPDGKTVVFTSEREGGPTLWRMGIDGSSPTRLGTGPVAFRPAISFDGQWVYYSDPERRNFRLALAGGQPEPLLPNLTADDQTLPPAFHEPIPSPDGRSLAGHYMDEASLGERIVVLSVDGPTRERRFPNVPANARWAPDGRSLIFSDGVNLWRQPIAGGEAVQITRFTDDSIFSFTVSADQRQWSLVRGRNLSDVVLVTNRPDQ